MPEIQKSSSVNTDKNGISVNNSEPKLATNSNPSGLPISGWNHYGNYFYSTKIALYTVAAVTATITIIVSRSVELVKDAAAFVGGITSFVGYVLDKEIPEIWYTDKVYYKTVVPNNPNQFRMKVAEKITHTFYEDSARTKHMKGSPITSEFWLRGYESER